MISGSVRGQSPYLRHPLIHPLHPVSPSPFLVPLLDPSSALHHETLRRNRRRGAFADRRPSTSRVEPAIDASALNPIFELSFDILFEPFRITFTSSVVPRRNALHAPVQQVSSDLRSRIPRHQPKTLVPSLPYQQIPTRAAPIRLVHDEAPKNAISPQPSSTSRRTVARVNI